MQVAAQPQSKVRPKNRILMGCAMEEVSEGEGTVSYAGIPDFNSHGIVPPIRPGVEGESIASDRSPYETDILSFCRRFGATAERRVILNGFLRLRADLQQAGVTEGFQWINGSFTEDVEQTQRRSPNDVDVVTFAVLGDEQAQRRKVAALPNAMNPIRAKETYHVDHYWIAIDRQPQDIGYFHRVAYWYSMWSHQRDSGRWKGFIAVPLHSNDAEARVWLASESSSSEGAS